MYFMLKKKVSTYVGKKSSLKQPDEHTILETYISREGQHLPFSCQAIILWLSQKWQWVFSKIKVQV